MSHGELGIVIVAAFAILGFIWITFGLPLEDEMTTTPNTEREAFEAWYQPERSPTDGLTVAKAFSAGWSAAQVQPVPESSQTSKGCDHKWRPMKFHNEVIKEGICQVCDYCDAVKFPVEPVPAADVPKACRHCDGHGSYSHKDSITDCNVCGGSGVAPTQPAKQEHKNTCPLDCKEGCEALERGLPYQCQRVVQPAKQEPCKHEWLTLKEDGVGALTVCRFCRATKPLDLPAKQEPQRCEHVAYQGNPCLPCGAAVPAIQVQEPVAYCDPKTIEQFKDLRINGAGAMLKRSPEGRHTLALFAAPQPEQPADLHNSIMNLQVGREKVAQHFGRLASAPMAYHIGHRDARHAAAELVAQQSNAHDQRELPALSDVEIDEIASGVFPDTFYSKPYKYKFARAVLLAAGSKP